jgi:hypothetical protein
MAQPCFAWTAAIHASFRMRLAFNHGQVRLTQFLSGVPLDETCVDGRLRGHDDWFSA